MSNTGGRKIREFNSLEVDVTGYPDPQPVQGQFIAVGNPANQVVANLRFGLVEFSPVPDARNKIVLNTENARWVTSQLAANATWLAGDLVYFDPVTANRHFLSTRAGPAPAAGALIVGIATEPGPDAAGMLEFWGGGYFYEIRRIAVLP